MNAQLVTISNIQIPLVIYRDQPVVTFAMIDQVHQRPEGTARKRFADNRERFAEGKHFYVVDSKGLSVLRTEFPGVFGANAPQANVFTERGYLKLVKTFTENLMHPQDEPASSSIKKGVILFLVSCVIFFLAVSGAISLAEKMGFLEFGIGIVALAALMGMALYLTD